MPYLIWDRRSDNTRGIAKAFSNRTVLSEFTGINYHTLTHHFVRNKEVWHYYEDQGVYVIKFEGLEKGRQRVVNKGTEHNRNI